MASLNLNPKIWDVYKNTLIEETVKNKQKITCNLSENDENQNEDDKQYRFLCEVLQTFNNLTEIKIIACKLPEIPDLLPDTLKCLYISNNQLLKLPKHLPFYLETIDISNNKITDLTPIYENYLPSLRILLAKNNPGLQLPKTGLPSIINILDLSNCELERITGSLPSTLIHFSCKGNRLKYLPEPLPASLEMLDCSYNQIEYLPPIQNQLVILKAEHNNLQFLDIDILKKLNDRQRSLIIEIDNNPDLPEYETRSRYADVHEIFDVKDIKNSEANYYKTNIAKSRYRMNIIRPELLIKYHDICFSPSRISRLITCGEMEITQEQSW